MSDEAMSAPDAVLPLPDAQSSGPPSETLATPGSTTVPDQATDEENQETRGEAGGLLEDVEADDVMKVVTHMLENDSSPANSPIAQSDAADTPETDMGTAQSMPSLTEADTLSTTQIVESSTNAPQLDPQPESPTPHTPEASSSATPSAESSPASASSSTSTCTPSTSTSNSSVVPTASTAPSSTRSSINTDCSTTRGTNTGTNTPNGSGILRSPSTTPGGVKFAPLPQIEGPVKKRAPGMQLGVAARSRMLRARKVQMMHMQMQLRGGEGGQSVEGAGVGTAALSLEQLRALEAASGEGSGNGGTRPPQVLSPVMKHPPVGFMRPEDEDDAERMPEEDALLALGRMVKGGARTLWRRVSHSQLRDNDKEKEKEKCKEEVKDDEKAKKGKAGKPPLRRSASLAEPRVRARPRSIIGGVGMGVEEGLTVSVLVNPKEALSADTLAPERERRRASIDGVDAVKVTEHVAHSLEGARRYYSGSATDPDTDTDAEEGPGAREGVHEERGRAHEEERGRVWEEVVGGEVQRRMEAVAAEQQERARAKQRGGLVGRLGLGLLKVGRRKEREKDKALALGAGAAPGLDRPLVR